MLRVIRPETGEEPIRVRRHPTGLSKPEEEKIHQDLRLADPCQRLNRRKLRVIRSRRVSSSSRSALSGFTKSKVG
jgi:hypothetical protein